MPRGGARPGAGRKPRVVAANDAVDTVAQRPAGFSETGVKSSEAPAEWPFGRVETPAERPQDVPKAPAEPSSDDPVITAQTPLDLLLKVVQSTGVKLPIRMQAAAIAAPFCHAKPAPLGKKEDREGAAKEVGKGKFRASAPPKLVAAAGRKI